MPLSTESIAQIRGQGIATADGEELGTAGDVFVDYETRMPEWVEVTSGSTHTVIPAQTADFTGGQVVVPFDRQMIESAPAVSGDDIPESLEQDLYRYYNLDYDPSGTTTPQGEGSSHHMDGGDNTITRSEEEIAVGKRQVDAGQVRLRKWVETEQVEVPVELQRDKVEITREPVNGETSTDAIGEQEIEVALHAEEPVVEKRAVAKERVTASKGTESMQQEISEEVRKERIEIEGDDVEQI